LQTARITEIESGAMKMEMRGHDNRVESAVFVPAVSIPAVRELVAQVLQLLRPSNQLTLFL
jgi:platelet-activating factor acetylhydrolase IB subunit alpha